MKCDKCNEREATVHLVTNINGNKTEMHLCEECAQRVKSESVTLTSAADFLTSFFEPFSAGSLPFAAKAESRCKKCGTTLSDFSGSGYLGCSECYEQFKDYLPPVIRRMHGKTEHVGKIPKGYDKAMRQAKEYEELKEQLKGAIDDERYEEAAKIRDKIKKLTEEQ